MRSKFSRELPEAVLRLKGPEERVRQSLESLRRLTNADGESDGAAMQVLNEDALRSARAAVYAANLLSGQVSELIRTYAPEEFSQNQKNNLLLDPVCAVSVTEDSVLLRVPLVPYSVQRNAQRRRAAGEQTAAYSEYFARRRYTEVNALLDRVLPVTMNGRKLLYILHVFHTQSRFRMSPDFDNYDVKDLIDVVMAAMTIHMATTRAGETAFGSIYEAFRHWLEGERHRRGGPVHMEHPCSVQFYDSVELKAPDNSPYRKDDCVPGLAGPLHSGGCTRCGHCSGRRGKKFNI